MKTKPFDYVRSHALNVNWSFLEELCLSEYLKLRSRGFSVCHKVVVPVP